MAPSLQPLPIPAAGAWRAPLRRPQALVAGCVILLAALGWAYLAAAVLPELESGQGALGPGTGWGMGWVAKIAGHRAVPAWLEALCAVGTPTSQSLPAAFATVFAMWVAMGAAMMLPTAAPMLLTYADRAESAVAGNEPAASPLWLLTGYAAVWVVFAALAGGVQLALARGGLLASGMGPARSGLAAALFFSAGAYQFTPLKDACLTACKHPVTFFAAQSTARARDVLGLGLQQGLFCLGCCWAAMLLMFAVGVMNIVWMAGLGVAMALEKVLPGVWFTRTIGVIFLLVSAGLTLAAAHVLP